MTFNQCVKKKFQNFVQFLDSLKTISFRLFEAIFLNLYFDDFKMTFGQIFRGEFFKKKFSRPI